MKKAQLRAIANRVLPLVPDAIINLPLIIQRPIRPILRGLCFESHSSNATLFYAWVFAMPLYIPQAHIALNLGQRIPDANGPWSVNDASLESRLGEAIQGEALPYLSRVRTPAALARFALTSSRTPGPYSLESAAYSYARVGRTEEALQWIDKLLPVLDSGIDWQRATLDRARMLGELLGNDVAAAQAQLNDWEEETLRNLGLNSL